MKHHDRRAGRALLGLAALVAGGAGAALALPACWDSTPCDPGQLFINELCVYPPDGGGDGGALGGDGGGDGPSGDAGDSGGDAGASGGDAGASGGDGGDAGG